MKFCIRLLCALSLLCAGFGAAAEEKISHGRFDNVELYRPQGEPKSFVLFFSGDGGWDARVQSMARVLTAQGALVAGVNTPALLKQLEADGGDCVYTDGDVENLSRYLQAYARVPTYFPPLLAGYGSGSAVTYALMTQADPGSYAGALALGFTPDLHLNKPFCKGEGVAYTKRKKHRGVSFLPVKHLRQTLIALQGEADAVTPLKRAREFLAQVPNAEVVVLPKVGHGYTDPEDWLPQFHAAYAKLTAQLKPAVPPVPKSIADLPVVEVAPQGTATGADAEVFAILLSGDGGWASIDKDVAEALSKDGIPVAGFDSLRYFWKERTPAGAAADVDRLIRFYSAQWKRKRVLLIGYSQGADVLPFIYNRLSPATRAQVALLAPIALSTHAAFEFHLSNWIGGQGDLPTLPEMQKLAGNRTVMCIHGEDEDESLCPKLDPKSYRIRGLPGGHHFDGDYDKLAEVILQALRTP